MEHDKMTTLSVMYSTKNVLTGLKRKWAATKESADPVSWDDFLVEMSDFWRNEHD